MSYLGLPPIPPDLKPITSYLQRAHETRAQDPVISYWCTYYAAQVGISLKAVSTPNRNFLAALLTTLENLRSVVGSSDAITVESASSAYVENFALLVFASADDEDRRGIATRKTAKKFLAAATFFEVLNVFEDRGPWEAHEEKGRYAKWRAADISKALREGRQPTPVSNGGDLVETSIEPMSAPLIPPAGSNDISSARVNHELEGPYSTSATALVATEFATNETGLDVPSVFREGGAPFEIAPTSAPVPINGTKSRHTAPTESPSLPSPMGSSTSRRHRADSKASSGAPPSSFSSQGSPILGQERDRTPSPSNAPLNSFPRTTVQQRPASPTHVLPRNPPPSTVPYLNGTLHVSAPPPPQPPYAPYAPILLPPPAPPAEMSPLPELTPSLIALAQKRCRFAISALDYDDAEQARKELRAALAILGG